MEWSVGKEAPWGLVLVANPVLLGLGAILVLPLARMPLLKLYWQHGTSVLPSCVCYLARLGLHLYSKSQLRKNHNFGTATS